MGATFSVADKSEDEADVLQLGGRLYIGEGTVHHFPMNAAVGGASLTRRLQFSGLSSVSA